MALKMALTAKGFAFTDAHIEITMVHISRDNALVDIAYRVYANRAAAVASPQQNVIKEDTLTLPFADLAAALGPFYTALQAKLLELYPAAVPANDAF